MQTVRKSVLVGHPAETMFDLVENIESYPDFLPWCAATEVPERTPELTLARLDIDYHGLRTHIRTRNRKFAPDGMDLDFVEGPFEHFKAHWRFVPLGTEGCRVDFSVDYSFSSKTFEAILGPVFGYIVDTLVERFVARADHPERHLRRRGS